MLAIEVNLTIPVELVPELLDVVELPEALLLSVLVVVLPVVLLELLLELLLVVELLLDELLPLLAAR